MKITGFFEKSTLIDTLTVLVLAYDAFLLYNGLRFGQGQVFGVSTNPQVIAVQLTALLVVIYGLEAFYDWARGSGGNSFGH
ncbi:MAG: hypothetical protein ABEJ75_01155 [Candidatus Nanohaloarchaea archaeon]